MKAPTKRPRRVRFWGLALSLLMLAPICAEYLWAYDASTGDPAVLLGNLILLAPLYGCAALLIREVARRARLGWTGILLLATAFGFVQAGLVDQGLFNPDYLGIEIWDTMFATAHIAPLGLSATNLIGFVGGHVMLSICGPIALVEAWRPQRASEPWLGLPGLVVTALAYVVASLVVLQWHLETEAWHATPGQLIGTGVVVIGLIGGAFLVPRRRRGRGGLGPGLGPTALVSLTLATAYTLLPESWLGVAGRVAVLLIAGFVLAWAARTARWGPTHIAIVGAAPLLLTAALAFTYDPLIGAVPTVAKYGHNTVMLLIVLAALGVAVLRRRPQPREDRKENDDTHNA